MNKNNALSYMLFGCILGLIILYIITLCTKDKIVSKINLPTVYLSQVEGSPVTQNRIYNYLEGNLSSDEVYSYVSKSDFEIKLSKSENSYAVNITYPKLRNRVFSLAEFGYISYEDDQSQKINKVLEMSIKQSVKKLVSMQK